MFFRIALCVGLILCGSIALNAYHRHESVATLPLVAIANYGPHASLQTTITGLKAGLAKAGFVENQTVRYQISDVGFSQALIPQMVTQLASQKPAVMVVMTTPVAQFAKGALPHLPLVYSAITDPVQVGLIPSAHQATDHMTGSSDKQNLTVFLTFVKKLLPHATRIGLLYGTSEPNDKALVEMMQRAAAQLGMTVVTAPVGEARDVPFAVQRFKGRVDLIYVGASGPIQPSLPMIAAEAARLSIPVFNVEETAVKQGLVLASFGVNYYQVGLNTSALVVKLLKGANINTLAPTDPGKQAYQGMISRQRANALHIQIPPDVGSHVTVVD